MRYFMYKYMIQGYDCSEVINIIYMKIDSYINLYGVAFQCKSLVCTCESRDSCSDLIFSRKELEVFIEWLCIK